MNAEHDDRTTTQSSVWNVPNQITVVRLVLSFVVFALLSFDLFLSALIVFTVAVSTDWIDGYIARKYNLVTVLGRILDPFVDKIIICGTFIMLCAAAGSQIAPWMTVVIVGRELLVTALRGFLEQRGADFSASTSGKLKMLLQCFAAIAAMWQLWMLQQAASQGTTPAAHWAWIAWTTAWAAVLLTVYSGIVYVLAAVRLVRPS